MKKLEFIVHLFEDRSVGINGGTVPINVELPLKEWNQRDEEERKEILETLKSVLRDLIDSDGECQTYEEYVTETEALRKWENDF